ncbi:MAG TPA: GAF domain-containing protein [Verrucomicrobiota bacterium]|nr:GAF domain-containing protein [Verrucomicrobiota bacterium]
MSDIDNIHPAIQIGHLERLYNVSKVIHSTLDQQEALDLIVREAVRLVNATTGSVVLANPADGLLEIQAAHGLPDGSSQLKLRLGEGLTGWVAQHGKPALVPDVRNDLRYVKVHDHTLSELAIPLEVNGSVCGVINVDSDQLNAFSETDQALLTELASQAATVIHNAFLYEQSRIRADLFESLITVGQAINSAVDLDDALTAITREAYSLMSARTSALQLLDEGGDRLTLVASHGAGQAYLNKPDVIVSESFLGSVVHRMKPLQIENIQTSNTYQQQNMAREVGLVALLSVPLVFGGSAIGTLNIYKADAYVFSNDEIRIAMALAELSAIAIEKARLLERIVESEEHLRQNEKLSALGLLAGEVAHEIRNPLTVLKMLYHSLGLEFPEKDPRTEDVRIMGEKMDHLNTIVEQVLTFARNAEPQLQPTDVNKLIDDLSILVRRKIAQQKVELETRLAKPLPQARADAPQLSQVFLNLTLNALEAMPDGGRLAIETRAIHLPKSAPEPTHVRIEFADTGCGMDAETRERAFTSLLNTSKPGGSGLGLAIVGRIVESHAGRIKIKPSATGTTFSILLPVAS